MHIKHLLFDNDGTLVDSEILAVQSMLGLLREHGFDMDERAYSQRYPGLLEREIIQIITKEHQIELPPDFLSRLHDAHQLAFTTVLKAIPGVTTMFRRLKAPKSIVSNASVRHVERCLRRTRLRSSVDGQIFSADHVNAPKPAPDVYLLALDTLKLKSHQTVVVEDSPVGVRAAKAAGLNVIGFLGAAHIQDGHDAVLQSAGADWIARDAKALSALFQEWHLL